MIDLARTEIRVSAVRTSGLRFIMRNHRKTSKMTPIIFLDNLDVGDFASSLGGDMTAFLRPGGDRRGFAEFALCTPANERHTPAQLGIRDSSWSGDSGVGALRWFESSDLALRMHSRGRDGAGQSRRNLCSVIPLGDWGLDIDGITESPSARETLTIF